MTSVVAAQRSAMASFDAWQAFVDEKEAIPPTMPSRAKLKKMSEEERTRDIDQRADWNARPHIAATPELAELQDILDVKARMNKEENGAREVVIVDGPTHVGKTTALLHVGRRVHRSIVGSNSSQSQKVPRPGEAVAHHIPVVLSSVPEGPTAKKVTWNLALFMNLVDAKTNAGNQTQIAHLVSHQASLSGTRFVFIDELHFLGKTRDASEAGEAIKSLMNVIPATFVLSGIHVVRDTLTQSKIGAEILGRATVLRFRPWEYKNVDQRGAWNGLIKEFEKPLLLAGHRENDVTKYADLIHEKVLGYPGAAGKLVRELATRAVLDGSERITKAAIDAFEPPELDDDYGDDDS